MNNFIIWQSGTKIPLSYKTGLACDPHDKANQTTLELAKISAELQGENVGMVINEGEGLFFIDIDIPLGGELSEEQNALIDKFQGAYRATSQNGYGIHIIGKGTVTEDRRVKCKTGEFDMLCTSGRFVALTEPEEVGRYLSVDHSEVLAEIAAQYLVREKRPVLAPPPPQSDTPGLSDELVISKAMNAKTNAFSKSATFKQLYTADADALHLTFPDDHDAREYDGSRADSALAQHLAFWCAGDVEQIERIMRGSALMRDKWDVRETYLVDTINNAVDRQDSFYTPKVEKNGTGGSGGVGRVGLQFLTPTQQEEYFKGCVYIADIHRVLTPSGYQVKPPSFKAAYGGYIFALDALSDKTTRNAFEAFTESQAFKFPKADSSEFDPKLEFGTVTDGKCNVYKPYEYPRKIGDPELFIKHLKLLLPDDNDRDIVTSYLAAMIQLKGHKFSWCPVLQGTQGNGKSLLFGIINEILGMQYCHLQRPEDLGNSFNGWIVNKLAICIEEVKSESVVDKLKDMITNEVVAVQSKGQDQTVAKSCANFLMFTNHRDAIRKAQEDRRYSIFYTAQQNAKHLKRDGMGREYFGDLFKWLEADGYAIIHEYLATYKIGFDMNGHAPKTSSHTEVMAESLCVAEDLLIEAADCELPGFKGGCVDLRLAREYLHGQGKKIGPKQVKKYLENIGYCEHPTVGSQGRFKIDGVKKTVWIKKDSEEFSLSHPQIIEKIKMIY